MTNTHRTANNTHRSTGSQSQKEMAAKKKWQRIFFCHPHTGKIQGKHKNRNSLFATELSIALTIQQTQLVFSGHCAFSSQVENILNEYQTNRTLNISKFAFYPQNQAKKSQKRAKKGQKLSFFFRIKGKFRDI